MAVRIGIRGTGGLEASFTFALAILYLLFFQVDLTVAVNAMEEAKTTVLYNQSLLRNSTFVQTSEAPMSRRIRSSELQPPTNLQIDPTELGALKISWYPPDSQVLPETYEIILKNLTPSVEIQARKCRKLQSLGNSSLHMKVLGTDSSTYFSSLIPDTFYRVDVFALSEDERSAPASLSSSPLVPGIPPTLPPDKVSVDVISAQMTKVSWMIPDDIECDGVLLYYNLELNSTYDSSQIIKVEKNATSCALTDLMPGVEYSVRICASNRAGLGRYSKAVVFRNKGQQRELDMEAFEPTEFPIDDLDYDQEGLQEPEPGDTKSDGVNFNVQNFLIPEEILNFRGKGLKSAIELSWLVKWRPMYPFPAGEEFGAELEPAQQPLPGVMFRVLWGEKFPGPAEDVISGTLTRHTIRGLRAGTNYHIRIITIVPGGEGSAAYTVTMTAPHNEEEPSMSGHQPIPVNLRVNSVAQTHAEIGWELPMPFREYAPSTLRSLIAGFQIKYYQVEQLSTFRHGPSSAISRRLQLLNVTGASSSRALLQRLRPETAYEFTVRSLPTIATFPEDSQSPLESSEWSMVQGFETLGQRPLNPPGLIKINKVSTEHDFTDTLSPMPTHTTNPWFPDDLHNGNSERSDVDAAILVTWSTAPPEDGVMIAYRVYLTRNIYQSNAQWKEHIVSGDQNSTIIRALRPGQLYFLRMTSQNRHGLSPVSPVFVFRTAKANGQGFLSLKLPKEYLHERKLSPRRLERLLSRLDAWTNRNTKSWTDPEEKEVANEAKSLHWLILCAILAAVVVIVLLIALTLLCHCRGRSMRRSTVSAKSPTPRSPMDIGVSTPATQSVAPSFNSGHDGSSGYLTKDAVSGGQTPRFLNRGLPCRLVDNGAAAAAGPAGPNDLLFEQTGLLTDGLRSPPSYSSSGQSGFVEHVPHAIGTAVGRGSMPNEGLTTQRPGRQQVQPGFTGLLLGGRASDDDDDDFRTTPLDSDLESAKSNMITYPYVYNRQDSVRRKAHPPQTHYPLGLQEARVIHSGSPGGVAERLLPMGHAGLMGSTEIRGSDSEADSYRYPNSVGSAPTVSNSPPLQCFAEKSLPRHDMTPANMSLSFQSGRPMEPRKTAFRQTVGPHKVPPSSSGRNGAFGQDSFSATTSPETETKLAGSSSTAGSSGYGSGTTANGRQKSEAEGSFFQHLMDLPKPQPIRGVKSIRQSCTNANGDGQMNPKTGEPHSERKNSECYDREPNESDGRSALDQAAMRKGSLHMERCNERNLPHSTTGSGDDARTQLPRFCAQLSKVYSTEELSEEMANLEGLMKDLNAMAHQEFECEPNN
uniref:Fibronectin type III domain-containing protein 1 n=1 Tax=Schistocephalus solidus TaxID=70667 RepID=A0A0X3PF78_SCHSO